MRLLGVSALLGLVALACRATVLHAPTTPRYIVTAAPIDTGVIARRLCVAIDADDAAGVWWWEPGSSGCSSRSTGPGVFRAEQATIGSARGSGSSPTGVRFTVPLTAPPGSTLPAAAEVRLVVEAGRIRAPASGASVAAARRASLELPELPPGR